LGEVASEALALPGLSLVIFGDCPFTGRGGEPLWGEEDSQDEQGDEGTSDDELADPGLAAERGGDTASRAEQQESDGDDDESGGGHEGDDAKSGEDEDAAEGGFGGIGFGDE